MADAIIQKQGNLGNVVDFLEKKHNQILVNIKAKLPELGETRGSHLKYVRGREAVI